MMDEFALNFSTQRSTFVKSFWAGKLVQELQLTESELHTALESSKREQESHRLDEAIFPTDKPRAVSQALHWLGRRETSLSPRVYSMVTGREEGEEDRGLTGTSSLLCSDGTLDWTAVTEYLDAGHVLETRDIPKGARQCGRIAEYVHRKFSEDGELYKQLQDASNFAWMAHPLVATKCLSILNDGAASDLGVNTTILLLTPALERALGDVYLTVSGNKQCPHLLRDLLAEEELERVFSPTAMFLLCCLIGPPSGLNLRNILWHGFADHQEVPRKFALLLLVLTASLGRCLSAGRPGGGRGLVPDHRPLVSLPQEAVLTRVFEDLTRDSCRGLRELFSHSYFVLPSMLPTWQAALDAFLENDCAISLCLLLPSLEHGLRRVFACVNKCPERVITAEADSLYTTLDEILAPSVAGGPNLLIEELGAPKLEMLLDLLVHPEGPRLRDRISHGELSFDGLSRGLANHVLCVSAIFCAQYSLAKQLMNDDLGKCLSVESHYTSLFHPLSLLHRELENLQDAVDKLATVPVPNHMTSDPKQHLPHPHLPQHLFHSLLSQLGHSPPHPPYQGGSAREVLGKAWSGAKTLFVARWQVVGIMRQAVSNSTSALREVRETSLSRYSQLGEKRLRSRQRANYQVLTSSLPLYQECIQILTLLVCSAVAGLHTPAIPPPDHIKFYKKLLQFTENFNSHCSATHNRWEEANKLCCSIMDLILKHTSSQNLTQ